MSVTQPLDAPLEPGIAGSFELTDLDDYQYAVKFQGRLGTPTVEVADQVPGEAKLTLPYSVSVQMENKTPGRNAPSVLSGDSFRLLAVWPSSSAICEDLGEGLTAQVSDDPTHCTITVVQSVDDPEIPIGGTTSGTSSPEAAKSWDRLDEAKVPVYQKEFADGPEGWMVGYGGGGMASIAGDCSLSFIEMAWKTEGLEDLQCPTRTTVPMPDPAETSSKAGSALAGVLDGSIPASPCPLGPVAQYINTLPGLESMTDLNFDGTLLTSSTDSEPLTDAPELQCGAAQDLYVTAYAPVDREARARSWVDVMGGEASLSEEYDVAGGKASVLCVTGYDSCLGLWYNDSVMFESRAGLDRSLTNPQPQLDWLYANAGLLLYSLGSAAA